VLAELHPGQLFDEFFERADAARQRYECVRHFEHLVLALVHVLGDDRVCRMRRFRPLAIDEKGRDDAGDFRARIACRTRHRAHQSDAATAENETDLLFAEQRAEGFCLVDEASVAARRGAAKNAYGFDVCHGFDVEPARDAVKSS